MTCLTLTSTPPVRLSLEFLTPSALVGLTAPQIGALPLVVGNRIETVGAWFDVSKAGGETLTIRSASDRLDRIGAGLTTGEIIVEGEAGALLGCGMKAGAIRVDGSAGYGVGIAMSGGTISISGDAGDFIGAALPGERKGMTGGLITVGGSAGRRVGDRMTRGLIVVQGSLGAAAAGRMIAGTIVAGGLIGADAGVAMRRGSLLALGGAEGVLPSFGDSGVQDLVVFRLWSHHLRDLGFPQLADQLGSLRRLVGDVAIGGTGEILLPN